MALNIFNSPAMANVANPLNSIVEPNLVSVSVKPETDDLNNSSTNKNTGNEARINNREILIIKTKTGKSKKQSW